MPLLIHKLREANRRLSFWMDSMAAPQDQPVIATPDQMAGLLSELLRAGSWLSAEPLPAMGNDENDGELNLELVRYRTNVERLRDLMPSIHRQLLLERAHLEAQRSRVQSAAHWARASRQAL
jgi:hypothetical protein